MKKLLVTIAACGLFSGVAAAEPPALEDGELSAVKGGALSLHQFKNLTKKVDTDIAIGLSQHLGGKNSAWVDQQSFVSSPKGTTTVTQNATNIQNAGVTVGNVVVGPIELGLSELKCAAEC